MNHGISILFRAIPMAMALFCFCFGYYVFVSTASADAHTAGSVVFFLGSICIGLFATASVIIRQLIHRYTAFDRWFYPALGYTVALATFIIGILMFGKTVAYFVPGHVIMGLGLITACVSTVATSSIKFSMIPVNSALPDNRPVEGDFHKTTARLLIAIPIVCAAVAWVYGFTLIFSADDASRLVAGTVLVGIAAVCTSLIALVVSIVKQIANTFKPSERAVWPNIVLLMGTLCVLLGLFDIWHLAGTPTAFVGWVLIGLGLICYSISSKVILLAKVWKQNFPLAKRIPIIPVVTALAALFISSFLFEWAYLDPTYFVPARVLAGFGAICFTLFSIVSILESGTNK